MQEAKLPIIDLSTFNEHDEASLAEFASKIGAACRDVGFFYVVNHGVDAQQVKNVFAQSQSFFELPIAEKNELAMTKVGGNRGYFGFMGEVLDHSIGADNKEMFHSGLELPADDAEVLAGVPFRVRNAWPAGMPEFKKTMVDYYNACANLGMRLSRAFAKDLKQPTDFFASRLTRPMGALRILHYPGTRPDQEVAPGAGKHTDWGFITILATDDIGGLEVQNRSGEWLKAPVVPNAYVVNIGDMLMRWTNNVYVSTPHRVIHRSEKDRYSVAFFYDPNPEAVLESIPDCIPEGTVSSYKTITAGDYLQWRVTNSLPGDYKQLY